MPCSDSGAARWRDPSAAARSWRSAGSAAPRRRLAQAAAPRRARPRPTPTPALAPPAAPRSGVRPTPAAPQNRPRASPAPPISPNPGFTINSQREKSLGNCLRRAAQPLLIRQEDNMADAKRPRPRQALPPVHAHAAAGGLGAAVHVAAVRPDHDPEPVRTFGTFTDEIRRMADWLAPCGIETIGVGANGIYWIPAYEILDERGFDVQLVNARDAKHVPGRKTDVSDAQWLQRLHEHGLLR